METNEQSIIEQHLRGINLRVLWALIICTAVSVSTVLSVYYGFKTELKIMSIRIDLLQKQFDGLDERVQKEEAR